MEYKIEEYDIIANAKDNGIRIDIVCSSYLEITRSQIKKYCSNILLNGKKSKLSTKVAEYDKISFTLKTPIYSKTLKPQKYDLDIVYEDNYYIIVRKPPKIPIHPSYGHPEDTLCNYVNYYFNKQNIFLKDAGIVHRLDMDTEGLIIFAKSRESQEKIRKLFAERKINKKYYAIISGQFKRQRDILEDYLIRDRKNRMKYTCSNNTDIGKYAKLGYSVIKKIGNYSLLDIDLYTGRTHQIRVQMSTRNHPIIGDVIYQSKSNKYFEKYGLLLFSHYLSFFHPFTQKEITINKGIPNRFESFLEDYK